MNTHTQHVHKHIHTDRHPYCYTCLQARMHAGPAGSQPDRQRHRETDLHACINSFFLHSFIHSFIHYANALHAYITYIIPQYTYINRCMHSYIYRPGHLHSTRARTRTRKKVSAVHGSTFYIKKYTHRHAFADAEGPKPKATGRGSNSASDSLSEPLSRLLVFRA